MVEREARYTRLKHENFPAWKILDKQFYKIRNGERYFSLGHSGGR